MTLEGIDFAWYKPSLEQLRALGAAWAAGYLSTDATKNWTRALVAEYLAAGIGVVTVWETTTTRAAAGYAAGQADARAADAQRAALGLPADQVIYLAVDEDVPWSTVQAYFDGAVSVLGLGRVGTYGGYRVVEGANAHGIRYLWQTVAWSGGLWSAHADIRQPGGTLLAGQADVDYAEVPDFGQSPRPSTPKPPAPPTVAPSVLEDDMPQFTVPAGTAGQSGVTFARGKFSTVAFFADNTLAGGAKDPGAKLRVVIWADGGPQVHDAVVVANTGGKQSVLRFETPDLTHSVTVTREDGGTYPVFAEVS